MYFFSFVDNKIKEEKDIKADSEMEYTIFNLLLQVDA